MKKYSFQKIKSKLAQLLILWLLVLGFDNVSFLLQQKSQTSRMSFSNFNNLQFIVYPVLGIVMDVWSARLKLMKICVLATIPGLLVGFCSNILTFLDSPNIIVDWIGIIAFTLPFSLYRTNVVPLYVEQMIESPSSEVSATISWHVFALILPPTIMRLFAAFAFEKSHVFILQSSTVLATLYVLPCSYSMTPVNKYNDYPQAVNPVKLILNLLMYYCRKNTHYRRVVTYSDDLPKGLERGKQKYGGPFRDDEVEDVKTVLRILPLLLVCVLGHISYGTLIPFFNSFIEKELQIQLQHVELPSQLVFHSTILIMILIGQLIIVPCFSSYIPSMLKQIGIGLLLAFCSTVLMIVLQISEMGTDTDICFELFNDTNAVAGNSEEFVTPWLVIPLISYGICFCLIVITSLEFTLAQSPASMRGLLIGIWYMSWGIGSMIDSNLYFALSDCKIYYRAFKGAFGLAIFFVFLLFATRYKLRNRSAVCRHETLNNLESIQVLNH